jgi:predicted SAM-dependent methyltransferase
LVGALIRNRRFHIRNDAIARKEYLDIGCGPRTHNSYINLDYAWRPGIDICWDVTKGLPLPNESVRGVFTEHCLEHLPFMAVDGVLADCWRVLKPGGTIRVIVPDGELYLRRYCGSLAGETTSSLPYADGDRYQGLYSPMMSVNRIFRSHGHQFIYDFDTLRQLLLKNGFIDVQKEQCGSGRDRELLIDTEARAVESLYVEASKPGC